MLYVLHIGFGITMHFGAKIQISLRIGKVNKQLIQFGKSYFANDICARGTKANVILLVLEAKTNL